MEWMCEGVLRIESPEIDVVIAIQHPHLITRIIKLNLHHCTTVRESKYSLCDWFPQINIAHHIYTPSLGNTEILQGGMCSNCIKLLIQVFFIGDVVVVRNEEDIIVSVFLEALLVIVFLEGVIGHSLISEIENMLLIEICCFKRRFSIFMRE